MLNSKTQMLWIFQPMSVQMEVTKTKKYQKFSAEKINFELVNGRRKNVSAVALWLTLKQMYCISQIPAVNY